MAGNTMDNQEYGPLQALIGNWEGDKGLDLAPEPDGEEREPYYETLMFEAIGDVSNAEKEKIYALRYHQVVYRKRNGEVFHNETGYWMWSALNNTVMHSLTIPRGVCVLAGGAFSGPVEPGQRVQISVSAAIDNPDWGIIQSPFMRDNAKTLAFDHRLVIEGDTLTYHESTLLDIYGRRFDHTDGNTLNRVKG
jgi:hypothetical protein